MSNKEQVPTENYKTNVLFQKSQTRKCLVNSIVNDIGECCLYHILEVRIREHHNNGNRFIFQTATVLIIFLNSYSTIIQ